MLDLQEPEWLAIEREFCRRRLGNFIRRAWSVLEPGQPYVHGWHMDAISEHLEAVTAGQITRLLINIPPGTMKSMSTAVFWPAWEWGPRGMPSMRFIGATHEEHLAIGDNVNMRRLIQSDWYQRLWPTNMAGDQNAKTYFENDQRVPAFKPSRKVQPGYEQIAESLSWRPRHRYEPASETGFTARASTREIMAMPYPNAEDDSREETEG